MISHHWVKRHEDLYPAGHLPYVIPDEDKLAIKENIVEATIQAEELIRSAKLKNFHNANLW